MIVEGDPDPGGESIDLPRDDTGRPTSAVPVVEKDGRLFGGFRRQLLDGWTRVLASATPEGDDCISDASVCIRHGEGKSYPPDDPTPCERGMQQGELHQDCLHHDRKNRPRFREAFNAALVQTEHEWCRLMHLAADDGGQANRVSGSEVSLLRDYWSKPGWRGSTKARTHWELPAPQAGPRGATGLHVNLVDVNRRGGVSGLRQLLAHRVFRTEPFRLARVTVPGVSRFLMIGWTLCMNFAGTNS